jgi:diguanylate cyclase (GGDEF)-like protein
LIRVGCETVGDVEANEIRSCEARDAATALGYRRGELAAALYLAQIDIYRGRLDAAADTLVSVSAEIDAVGNLEDRLFCGSLLATVEMRRGSLHASALRFESLAALAADCPPSSALVTYLNRKGQTAEGMGDLDEALRLFFEALAVAEQIGARALQANMLSNLGSGQHDTGNYDDAIDLLTDALALIDEFGFESLRSITSSNMAMCKMAIGDFDAAWDLLTPLIEKPLLGQDPDDYAFFRLLGGEALLMRGNLSLAERFIDHGMKMAHEIHSSREIMHGELLRAQLALERKQPDKALEHLLEAGRAQANGAPQSYQAQMLLLQAKALAHCGQWEPAYTALEGHQKVAASLRAAARQTRLRFRSIAAEVQRSRQERDEALRREADAVNTSRELDRLNHELSTRLREVEQLREQLAEQSIKDHLTGIFNRRHFEYRIADLLGKPNAQFSVALIDLDHFKRVNDSQGHAVGDAVLVGIAHLLAERLRGGDFVARYGGEEFCVLLHRANGEQAAERMRTIAADYAGLSVAGSGGPLTGLTFSAGVAEFPVHGRTLEALMSSADRALYEVKHSTRNAVRVAQ